MAPVRGHKVEPRGAFLAPGSSGPTSSLGYVSSDAERHGPHVKCCGRPLAWVERPMMPLLGHIHPSAASAGLAHRRQAATTPTRQDGKLQDVACHSTCHQGAGSPVTARRDRGAERPAASRRPVSASRRSSRRRAARARSPGQRPDTRDRDAPRRHDDARPLGRRAVPQHRPRSRSSHPRASGTRDCRPRPRWTRTPHALVQSLARGGAARDAGPHRALDRDQQLEHAALSRGPRPSARAGAPRRRGHSRRGVPAAGVRGGPDPAERQARARAGPAHDGVAALHRSAVGVLADAPRRRRLARALGRRHPPPLPESRLLHGVGVAGQQRATGAPPRPACRSSAAR